MFGYICYQNVYQMLQVALSWHYTVKPTPHYLLETTTTITYWGFA